MSSSGEGNSFRFVCTARTKLRSTTIVQFLGYDVEPEGRYTNGSSLTLRSRHDADLDRYVVGRVYHLALTEAPDA